MGPVMSWCCTLQACAWDHSCVKRCCVCVIEVACDHVWIDNSVDVLLWCTCNTGWCRAPCVVCVSGVHSAGLKKQPTHCISRYLKPTNKLPSAVQPCICAAAVLAAQPCLHLAMLVAVQQWCLCVGFRLIATVEDVSGLCCFMAALACDTWCCVYVWVVHC